MLLTPPVSTKLRARLFNVITISIALLITTAGTCLLAAQDLGSDRHAGSSAAPAHQANSSSGTFYVATDGNDSWSGTLAAPNSKKTDGPFASLARAQLAVEGLLKNQFSSPITVMVEQGTYYLPLSPTNPGTLNFTAADSGTNSAPVAWQNYPGEVAVVSGGIPVTNWTHVSGALWQAPLPSGTQPFEYLFYNEQRRLRSRLQSADGVGYYVHGGSCISTQTGQMVSMAMCNLGTFLRVQSEVPPTGANANCPSYSNGTESKCMDRFEYNPSDPIAQWINLNPPKGNPCNAPSSGKYPSGDVELTLFDAWTVDVMRVSCVNTSTHMIYLTGATQSGLASQYVYFGPLAGHRYVVDNTRDAFNAAQANGQTGVWFLDRSTTPWTLNYLANYLENPSTDTVVIPQLGGAIPGSPATDYVGASLIFATNLQNVTFNDLIFEVDDFIPAFTGFNNDSNEELAVPQAIDCESCQNVTFNTVIVRHTSGSALTIASTAGNSGTPAANDVVENSAFYDLGSSGFRVGRSVASSDQPAYVPQFLTLQNTLIQGYSRVFADGEGIAMSNGHDVIFQNNDITDGYHAAISVCNNGCYSYNWAANGINIISAYNHAWDVMQGITSDGGTVYYDVGGPTGGGTGDQILNNLIHDVTDSSIIDAGISGTGYGGHGVYLDVQSAGMEITNNVIYHISSGGMTMTQGPAAGEPADTFTNNIVSYARRAMFEEQNPWPQNCTNSLRANITHNLFNFDLSENYGFSAVSGCSDSCGMNYNQFQNFQGNLYWRTDGGFASDPDAFSVMTDPPPPNQASNCNQIQNPPLTMLTFAQWQNGDPLVNGIPLPMNEDQTGTATSNPGFGDTGQPSDYLLLFAPVGGFNFMATNETILSAGRYNPAINPPPIPETFPTYTYSNF